MTASGRWPASNRPSLLIRNGRIIDPASEFDETGDLLIVHGSIGARGGSITPPDDAKVVDARGLVVTPGFVDIHTHLRYPGFPEKETLESGVRASAAGGFTTICAMANTNPVVDNLETLRHVYDEAERVDGVHVRQLAALSKGLAGDELTDFHALAEGGAVAFSDDGKPVQDAELMRRALRKAREIGAVISVHEEDPQIVGSGVANDGPPARSLNLPPWPCSGEANMVERDVRLLRETGGRLHVAHVSCAQTASLIAEAKAEGLKITAEVTPHHLLLTDELLLGSKERGLGPRSSQTKVNPPLRTQHDCEAVIDALGEGVIDAVATDHAPHTDADKEPSFEFGAFGFTGLELALPLLLELVRSGRLSLITLVERMTVGPARCFNLDAGTLSPGSAADVTIFDPQATWTVRSDGLQSRGKNTPLRGSQMTGKVIHTIVDGRVVFG